MQTHSTFHPGWYSHPRIASAAAPTMTRSGRPTHSLDYFTRNFLADNSQRLSKSPKLRDFPHLSLFFKHATYAIDVYAPMAYVMRMRGRPLHTVVETPEFLRRARRLMSDEERRELIDFLAANPDAGDVMPGTGGARKLRWATGTRGKRGGGRVITFFSGPPVPVFLLTVFGKNERIDLSRAEQNELRKVLSALVSEYREGARRHVQGR